jgi:nucleotide-binding universal stress UspA family protein
LYKKILVPLDGSTLAECALEHVKTISLGCNVPDVVLFGVVEPTYAISDALSDGAIIYTELINQIKKDADSYINNVTNTFKLQTGINAKSVLAYGNAANEILDYVKKNQVDLIIMITHGMSGISRWLFGNVADRVSHHSTVPVLIVTPFGCRLDTSVFTKEQKPK